MNIYSTEKQAAMHSLFTILATRIQSGQWPSGTRLPSERELATEFNVSRALIQAAIDELDAKGLIERTPNCRPLVRRDKNTRSQMARFGRDQIAVWIPQSLDAPGASAILQGIRNALGAYRYSVLVGCPEGPSDQSELPFLQTLMRPGPIAGAIILPSGTDTAEAYASLHQARVPLVFVDREPHAVDSFDLVGTNNLRSAANAVQHLVELGHRRIAMVANDEGASSVKDRYDGYYLAMSQAGLMANPIDQYQLSLGIGPEVTQKAMELIHLIRRDQQPQTAIFAVNDQAALHLYDAATSMGLRVPQDLSIVGFDWSLRWVPSGGHITTVCQHFDDIGRIAVDRLLERIGSHEDQVPRQILVEGTLVQKGSTSAPLPNTSLKSN